MLMQQTSNDSSFRKQVIYYCKTCLNAFQKVPTKFEMLLKMIG